MQLRAHSSVSDYEVSFVILSLLFVGVLALVAMAVFLSQKRGNEAQVVIYTPRHDSMDPTDAINIRIQFSPQQGLVQRFRAPSSLDLGPAALQTGSSETRKDI